MRLHVLGEITLTVENFIANRANGWLLFDMLPHVIEQLVEGRKVLLTGAARRRMVVAVCSEVRGQVVLLIE